LKKPTNILVIRLSAMGDVAMIVPVLSVFSEAYPEVQLTILSKAFFKPFFQDFTNVVFLEADVNDKHKGFKGLLKLSKEATSLEVNAVADLHNVIRSKIITRYLKVLGKKTATLNKGRKEKKSLTRVKNKKFMQLKTTHQRYADVFEALGFPIDLTNFKPLPKKEYNKNILNLLGEKKKSIIGIAPFAAYKSKMYPLALIKKVIAVLDKDHQYQIVLFGGGNKEISQLDTFENEFTSVINTAGKLNFTEELALISNLDVMISMDSGNGHLGAMYGIPIISLWGVTHPFAGFAPFGQPNYNSLLADNNKYPLLPTSIYGNNYPEEYENVMETIKPEEIVKKLESVLKINK
jgi:ADP-heptose:LPS heptosyltransferase